MKKSRKCPNCHKILTYASHYGCRYAERDKRVCKSCRILGEKHPRYGKKPPRNVSKAIVESNKRRIWTQEARDRMSKIIRQKFTSRMHKNKSSPNYNPIACKIFDEINKELGWSGRHALHEGEFYIKDLGYWVDYYEPNENVVIEYYESDHYKPSRVVKDLKRKREIVDNLKCKFYVVKENQNWKTILQGS